MRASSSIGRGGTHGRCETPATCTHVCGELKHTPPGDETPGTALAPVSQPRTI